MSVGESREHWLFLQWRHAPLFMTSQTPEQMAGPAVAALGSGFEDWRPHL